MEESRLVKALLFFGILLLLGACKEKTPEIRHQPIEGEIQLLNGSAIPGMAEEVRTFLIKKGYNVVSVGNAPEWNYDQTIIALRSPRWPGADSLRKDLRTQAVIPLENPDKMVDATIYIGHDIKERMQNE